LKPIAQLPYLQHPSSLTVHPFVLKKAKSDVTNSDLPDVFRRVVEGEVPGQAGPALCLGGSPNGDAKECSDPP
jgi:hypothetical protein